MLFFFFITLATESFFTPNVLDPNGMADKHNSFSRKKRSWFGRRSGDRAWFRSAVTQSGMAAHEDSARAPTRRDASAERLRILIDSVKDFQLTNGSLVKLVGVEQEHTVLGRPIGVALYPSRIPRASFEQAERLQTPLNELYAAVATDEKWLKYALRPLLTKGSLAAKLWSIHMDVAREGYVQDLSLGIFRSDYILQNCSSLDDAEKHTAPLPKQVEFNTYSCAGVSHFSRISALHRHLCKTGAYHGLDDRIAIDKLPHKDGINGIIQALAFADQMYRRQRGDKVGQTAVLMVVQPFNVNIADERPIEFGLWREDLPCHHIVWGTELLNHTYLSNSRQLFFQPPGRPEEPVEISVVYHRAGYDEAEYDIEGIQCRLRLERSRAIKCPSILAHLAGFKKVQQVLSNPGQVERFLDSAETRCVRQSFMPMYPLDESQRGLRGRGLALAPDTAGHHILKPSLEGGGHNVYRKKIPAFLESLPPHAWRHYVLMEAIAPMPSVNILVGPQGIYAGATESELGFVGACLWKNHNHGDRPPQARIELNDTVGFTLKSKARGVEEMSVIKGFGCFDSPLLVD